jgi:hypothetical protein
MTLWDRLCETDSVEMFVSISISKKMIMNWKNMKKKKKKERKFLIRLINLRAVSRVTLQTSLLLSMDGSEIHLQLDSVTK